MVTRRATGIYHYDAGRPSPGHVSRLISSRTPPCGAPCAGPHQAPWQSQRTRAAPPRPRAGQRWAPARPGRSPGAGSVAGGTDNAHGTAPDGRGGPAWWLAMNPRAGRRTHTRPGVVPRARLATSRLKEPGRPRNSAQHVVCRTGHPRGDAAPDRLVLHASADERRPANRPRLALVGSRAARADRSRARRRRGCAPLGEVPPLVHRCRPRRRRAGPAGL
jgi:hypothetical protein